MKPLLKVAAIATGLCAITGTALGLTSIERRTVEVQPAVLIVETYASVVRTPRNGIAEVRARAAGTVHEVYVREGDKLIAGQLLALIEVPGAGAEVQKRLAERNEALAKLSALGAGDKDAAGVLAARALAVQSELSAAEAKSARQQVLREHGSISDAALEQTRLAAEAARERYKALLADSRLTLGVQRPSELRAAQGRLAVAEAALEQARIALGLGEVTSAIAGVVLSSHIHVGDVIAAGTSPLVFEVADTSDSVLRGELDELDAHSVRVGLRAEVYALGSKTVVARGYVQQLGIRLERRKLGFADPRESLVRSVWLDVDWTRESGGASGPIGERFEARIQLPGKRVPAAVPRSALAIRDGIASVEVAWGPFFRRVPVKLASTDPQHAEVIGVSVGTRVRVAE